MGALRNSSSKGFEIPDEDRLLGVGDGLKVTQIRLGTARLPIACAGSAWPSAPSILPPPMWATGEVSPRQLAA